MDNRDVEFMKLALQEAKLAAGAGEPPIGAVLVCGGEVLVSAHNHREREYDITSHAEIEVLRAAGKIKKDWRMSDCTLYVTMEPCAMCAATMGMAGINHVYYGQSDPAFGKAAERLAQDTTAQNGFSPYPRVVHCELIESPLQKELETVFRKSGIREITKWLATDEAKSIFLKYLTTSSCKLSNKQ